MAVKRYECNTCKNHPTKKENNFVSIDTDKKGADIQGIRDIVDCHNVRFYKGQVICRSCEALLFEEAQ